MAMWKTAVVQIPVSKQSTESIPVVRKATKSFECRCCSSFCKHGFMFHSMALLSVLMQLRFVSGFSF